MAEESPGETRVMAALVPSRDSGDGSPGSQQRLWAQRCHSKPCRLGCLLQTGAKPSQDFRSVLTFYFRESRPYSLLLGNTCNSQPKTIEALSLPLQGVNLNLFPLKTNIHKGLFLGQSVKFLAAGHAGSQCNQGSNPYHLQWKCRVLTTGFQVSP